MKKIARLFYLSIICFLGSLFCMGINVLSVKAASNEFSITKITRGYNKDICSEVEKYQGIDGIWVTKEGLTEPLLSYERIYGTYGNDIKSIKCRNAMNIEYDVSMQDGSFEIYKDTEYRIQGANGSLFYYGAYDLYFEVEYQDGHNEIETLIVSESGKNNDLLTSTLGTIEYPTKLQMYNSEYKKVRESTINYDRSEGFLKYLDLTSEENGICFQIDKECKKEKTSTQMNWISNNSNYIVINGDIENKIPLCASNIYYGNYYSAPIELKDGYNVIEVYSDCYLSKLNYMKRGSSRPLGIQPYTTAKYGATYIIKSNGTKKIEKSSDTSLRSVEATAILEDTYPEYPCIKENDGYYTIKLPLEYVKSGSTVLSKMCFGLTTTDPAAKAKILNLEPIGNTIGNYSVYETAGLEKIEIEVTAADGTVKTHTVKVKRVDNKADIDSFSIEGGTLNKEFNSSTTSYHINVTGEKITYNITTSIGADVTLNGKTIIGTGENENEYSFEISPSDYHSIIKLVSGDGAKINTYYFHYDDEKNEPLYEIPKKTKELANSMLQGWKSRNEQEINEKTSLGYWGIFMAKATNFDLSKNLVYNVSLHEKKQATDWAACIMELVMIGENPYNFEGTNYIEGLLSCRDEKSGGYGPYANNIWALEAFKTAGYPLDETLIKMVKNQALADGPDYDMRSWAVAAISEYLTEDEKAQILINYKNAQLTEGKISDKEIGLFYSPYYTGANTSTNGDVLMALAQLNVNMENYFDMNGKNPLTILRDYYMTSDGGFVYDLAGTYEGGYNKDMIVGLGDIVNGSNVWTRYALTEDMKVELIKKAKSLISDAKDKEALQNAIDKAEASVYGTTDFGISYFALYEEMTKTDDSMKMYYRMCTAKESEDIDNIISTISAIGKVSISSEELLNKARTAYDSISTDKAKAYVTNYAVLTDAEAKYDKLFKEYIASLDEKIANLGDVDDLTIENQAEVKEVKELYDTLSDSQKKSLENGKTVQKAVNKMAALEVEALIEVIPEEVTLKNEKEIQAARKAYNELTTAQKRLVLSETYVKLTDAEKALKALKKPVVTIKLNKTSLTLKQNQKVTLKATVSSKEDVFWTSSNPKVASVDNSGVVTSYKDGTTVIKAFTKNGDKATCTVKVNAKLQLKANANKLTWKKIADAKGYKVYQYNSTSKKYKKIATLSASKTSYTVNKLNAGTNYTFKVTSYKVENGKDVTKKSEVVKTATKPAKVTINKVAKKSAKSIKITWKKTKATGYEVWMKSSKNGAYKLVKTITKSSTTSYTKSNLAKNKTYTFKIRAYKNVGDQTLYGAYSTAKSLKLK